MSCCRQAGKVRNKQCLKCHPFHSERLICSVFQRADGAKGNGSKPSRPGGIVRAHRGFRHIDADEEYQLGDEQVDAQVFVDGVAVALQAPEEAKGEDADGEADQGHHDSDSGDDGQEQLVPDVVPLRGVRVERHPM